MSDSPAEYVEQLKSQNKILRANIVQLVNEKNAILEHIARQDIRIKDLRRQRGLAAHDFEPEVD